jgi:hypothetical protein
MVTKKRSTRIAPLCRSTSTSATAPTRVAFQRQLDTFFSDLAKVILDDSLGYPVHAITGSARPTGVTGTEAALIVPCIGI